MRLKVGSSDIVIDVPERVVEYGTPGDDFVRRETRNTFDPETETLHVDQAVVLRAPLERVTIDVTFENGTRAEIIAQDPTPYDVPESNGGA